MRQQMMNIQALKIDLIQKILKTQDKELLVEINDLLVNEVEKDWWDHLPKEVQNDIFEGIQDIENGNVFTYDHDQVINEAK